MKNFSIYGNAGNRCQKCGSFEGKILNVRHMISYTSRRRQCECGYRYSTVEIDSNDVCSQTAALILRDLAKLSIEEQKELCANLREGKI